MKEGSGEVDSVQVRFSKGNHRALAFSELECPHCPHEEPGDFLYSRPHSPRPLTVIHIVDNLLLKILFLDLLLILACLLPHLSGYSSLPWALSLAFSPSSALEARLLLFIPSPPSTHASSAPWVFDILGCPGHSSLLQRQSP